MFYRISKDKILNAGGINGRIGHLIWTLKNGRIWYMEAGGESKKKAKVQGRHGFCTWNQLFPSIWRHVKNMIRALVQEAKQNSLTKVLKPGHTMAQSRPPPASPFSLPSDRILARKFPFMVPHLMPWPYVNKAWHPTPLPFLPQDISLPALTGCTATE